MSVPEGTGPGANPGLYASIRSFWGALVAILYTRLDLVTAEMEDEAVRALKLVVAGVIALLAFATAFFFANFLLIVAFWPTAYRLWVVGGVTAAYLLIGVIAALTIRSMITNRPKFLAQTIAELRRDAEALSRVVAVKKDEVKS